MARLPETLGIPRVIVRQRLALRPPYGPVKLVRTWSALRVRRRRSRRAGRARGGAGPVGAACLAVRAPPAAFVRPCVRSESFASAAHPRGVALKDVDARAAREGGVQRVGRRDG